MVPVTGRSAVAVLFREAFLFVASRVLLSRALSRHRAFSNVACAPEGEVLAAGSAARRVPYFREVFFFAASRVLLTHRVLCTPCGKLRANFPVTPLLARFNPA